MLDMMDWDDAESVYDENGVKIKKQSRRRDGKKMYLCPIEDCDKVFPDHSSFRKH